MRPRIAAPLVLSCGHVAHAALERPRSPPELASLPPGEYVIVPANDTSEPSAELEAELEAAFEEAERDEFVDAKTAFEAWRTKAR